MKEYIFSEVHKVPYLVAYHDANLNFLGYIILEDRPIFDNILAYGQHIKATTMRVYKYGELTLKTAIYE